MSVDLLKSSLAGRAYSESIEPSSDLYKAHADLLLCLLFCFPIGTCQRYSSNRVCCLVIGHICRDKISRAVLLQPQESNTKAIWLLGLY